MSTTTIMTLSYETGFGLLFFTPIILGFILLVLYVVWPIRSDKDDILDIN